MKQNLLTYAVLFLLPLTATAQVDSTIVDTSAIKIVKLSADSSAADSISPDKEKPLFKVDPWNFHAPMGAKVTATDSTLRWQTWPDWTYKLNRDPGVISYRMGTNLRSNAVQRYAHEPRHQQLYWEGISLNDPVSGMLNWSLIPQHKISKMYGEDLGTQYRSTYYLHQYYLNKPLSRLIYRESKFSSRSLQFEVSHNFSQRTNLELGYWDRRAGGEYTNSEITGRQIYVKASHHLDHRHYLKLNYVNNKMDIGRPFGYVTGDLRGYNFDRFDAVANEPSAASTEINNLLALNFYRRSADTSHTADNFHASLFQRVTNRSISFSTDSTAYNVRSIGATARKWWEWGPLETEGGLSYEYFINRDPQYQALQTGNWGLLKGDAKLSIQPSSYFKVQGGGAIQSRSDGFQSYRLNAGADLDLAGFTLSPALSSGTIMPSPQQLYWESKNYTGRSGLQNEEIQEARLSLTYHFTKDTDAGFRLQHKDITNGIMVGADSTFKNISAYASQSATAYFNWDASHFELKGSATLHQFTNSFKEPDLAIPMSDKQRIWFKGGAYWKGYLFDKATYVKAGLSGMITPSRYQADHYNPELDYWQSVSNDQKLPVFSRLDVDISARVRSIVFVLRWQNVLDDVNQPGYFETAGYPMSQRRFMFGVRALFRN